ncbi:MAG: chitosanase [Alphaproteobacteria bacterium]|nr:chitosanase [Alphaproteobacteria bacterium]
MADGVSDIGLREADPPGMETFAFGDDLERLLDGLDAAGLILGVRERTSAFLVAARWLEGLGDAAAAPGALRGLRPLLAPVIARTRGERAIFFEVFDGLYGAGVAGPPPPAKSDEPVGPGWLTRNRLRLAGAILLIVLLVSAAFVAAQKLSPKPETLEPILTEPAPPYLGGVAPVEAVEEAAPQERDIQTTDQFLERVLRAAEAHDGAPSLEEVAASVFADSGSLASASAGGFNWRRVREVVVLRGHEGEVTAAVFSPDGQTVLTGGLDDTAKLWSVSGGEALATLAGHANAVSDVAFSPDGTKILTGTWGGEWRIWPSAGGEPLITSDGHEDGAINAVAYSPDGRRVLTGSDDDTAKLWDASTGRLLATFAGHTDQVHSVAFSPDGATVLTGSWDETARLWPAGGGEPRATLAHEYSVWPSAYSPDGTMILTGTVDGATLWRLADQQLVTTFEGHDNGVVSVAFSPDGSLVLTGSFDGTAKIWLVSGGSEIATLTGHTAQVNTAVFSPDGSQILTSSEDGTARIWAGGAIGAGPAWTADAYAERLHELTGLPLSTPLPVFGLDAPDTGVWARLAQALGRIEEPGAEPSLDELEAGADAALADGGLTGADRPRVYRAAARIEALAALDVSKTDAELFAEVIADPDVGPGPPSEIERAFAMLGRDGPPSAKRPWMGEAPRRASQAPPAWLPWIAGGAPLFLAFWFASAFAFRKAYLRRRAPKAPPLHTDLVSNAGRRVGYSSGLFQRAAQRLLTRTPRASDRLDVNATIDATLRAGGEMIQPVYSGARARPDYLVLIERATMGDQEARRLRQMVEWLQSLVDVDVFYFQTDPGELESEDGARRITIEQAQSSYPDHRLIVLGTGVGFLDPVTFEANSPARRLLHWERRALLTPIPLAEWGREEYALAHSLDMAVGRATPEGLLTLAELLGLEGAEAKERRSYKGDGLARPLPDLLRNRPQRFLFSTPPGEETLADVLRELRNYLDPASFDWFAALAVYPAVQWDLTLYLGVELPRQPGGDAGRDPLYSEDRLAAITQLPWLKAGRMPNWLRSTLIAKLSPVRAGEVKAAIERAIEAGRVADRATEERLLLRIGRESPKEAIDPRRLFEDDVLLDFLSAGRREDFALPRLSRLREFFDRTFWESLGGPEGIAGAAALAYAAAAVLLAPKAGAAAVTGAYAPLLLLLAGGLATLLVWNAPRLGRSAAGLAERAAPGALALAAGLAGAGIVILSSAVAQNGRNLETMSEDVVIVVRDSWISGLPFPAWLLLLLPLMLLVLPAARLVCERLRVRVFIPQRRGARAALSLVVRAGWLGLVAAAAVASASTRVPMIWQALLLAAAGFLAVFLFGLLGSRFAPRAGSLPRREKGRTSAPVWLQGVRGLAILAPVALAGLAAWQIDTAHARVALEDETGGAMRPGAGALTALSADGSTLVMADATGRIVLSGLDGKVFASVETGARGPFSALVLGGERGARVVAFADAEGRVSRWTESMDAPVPFASGDASGAQVRSHGAPALLAFGADGGLIAAVEADGAASLIVEGAAALMLPQEAGPPVALALVGPEGTSAERFAVATLDGAIRLIAASPAGSAATTLGAPGEGLAPARAMHAAEDGSIIRAVLTDGSLVEASLAGESAGVLQRTGEIFGLGLGGLAEWTAKPAWERPAAAFPELTYGQLVTINAIIRVFETGSVSPDYGFVSTLKGDPGGISYGIPEASLTTGNLKRLVDQYRARADARYATEFEPYLRPLDARDRRLDADVGFKSLLGMAADDPAMQAAQEQFFLDTFTLRALRWGRERGVREPLSHAVIYDSFIQNGRMNLEDQANKVAGALNSANEREWIEAYVNARREWLGANSIPGVRVSVMRMLAFEALIGAGAWELELPLDVPSRGQVLTLLREDIEPRANALARGASDRGSAEAIVPAAPAYDPQAIPVEPAPQATQRSLEPPSPPGKEMRSNGQGEELTPRQRGLETLSPRPSSPPTPSLN